MKLSGTFKTRKTLEGSLYAIKQKIALRLGRAGGRTGMISASVLGVFFLAMATEARAQDVQPASEALPLVEVTIETADGSVTFVSEQASTPRSRREGLMFRTELGPREGMLFTFAESKTQSMWMKNTYLSLDMLFINEGRIVDIAHRTLPLSLRTIASSEASDSVFEVLAGTAESLGIAVGDEVRWSAYEEPQS